MENKLKLAKLKAKRRKEKQDASETILRRLEEAVEGLKNHKVDVEVDTTELKQILGELELSPTFKSGDVVVDTEIFAKEIKGLREDLEKGIRQPSEIKRPLEELVDTLKLKPSQKPENFIPYRRVVLEGKRLRFDDSVGGGSWAGGAAESGGSIDTTGLATEAKQDDIITAVQGISGGGGGPLADYVYIQKDTADVTHKYYGYKKANGDYLIKQIARSTNLALFFADVAGDYNTDWSGRAGLTYGQLEDVI